MKGIIDLCKLRIYYELDIKKSMSEKPMTAVIITYADTDIKKPICSIWYLKDTVEI